MLAAIEAARNDLDAPDPKPGEQPDHEAPDLSAERPDTERATRGDGLRRMCASYLTSRAITHPDRARRDRAQLTGYIDPVSGWARLPDGELLAAGTITVSFPGLAARPLQASDLT